MAATGLLALIDDFATILDDVAAMTKVAAKKTAGVVGDDLALNAKALQGIDPSREIPIVLAVARGSAINKVIIIPAALIISVLAPWLIKPLLMLGGAFLCFEGVEKLIEKFLHKPDHGISHAHTQEQFIKDPVAFEAEKIKGAVRTDFILSAEVIVIALNAVAAATLAVQVGVLVTIGVAMTVLIYGLVAGLIKLDDLGLHWSKKKGFLKICGEKILVAAPVLMKIIGIIGTAAMFIVGGEIIVHGIYPLDAFLHDLIAPFGSGFVHGLAFVTCAAFVGIVSGILSIPLFKGAFKIFDQLKPRLFKKEAQS
jgi:predicted DNA repair protein MutK